MPAPTQVENPPALPTDSTAAAVEPAVDMRAAMRALTTGVKATLAPVWSVPQDFGKSFYHPPTPIMGDGSIFVGDNTCYRRIDAASGHVTWDAKLTEGEEFLSNDPVIVGNHIGLRYQYPRGENQLQGVGFVLLDSKSGQVKMKVAGDFISEFRTDAAGHVYYTADDGALKRVTAQGVPSLLRPPQGSMVCLTELQVTAAGVPFYQRIDRAGPASALRLLDGLQERTVTTRYTNQLLLRPNGGAYASLDYGTLVSLDDSGHIGWERKEPFATTHLGVTADDGLVAFNDSQSNMGLVCYGADGELRWRHPIDDPPMKSLVGVTDWQVLPRPDGDILLLESRHGVAMALGPDGQERWKRLWEPCAMTITRDDKLYLSGDSGFLRLDLKSGQTELEYSREDRTFKRYHEGTIQYSATVEDAPAFCGHILQAEPDTILAADSSRRFSCYQLPAALSADMLAQPAASQRRPGEVERLDGYVRLGGVLVPVRRS